MFWKTKCDQEKISKMVNMGEGTRKDSSKRPNLNQLLIQKEKKKTWRSSNQRNNRRKVP